jgi:hypothetical protein
MNGMVELTTENKQVLPIAITKSYIHQFFSQYTSAKRKVTEHLNSCIDCYGA